MHREAQAHSGILRKSESDGEDTNARAYHFQSLCCALMITSGGSLLGRVSSVGIKSSAISRDYLDTVLKDASNHTS